MNAPRYRRAIVWLRRDLRLRDNVALAEAGRRADEIAVAFVLDRSLLASKRMGAALVTAFFGALAALRGELRELGSDLVLLDGGFEDELVALARALDASAVFFNEDYEPGAIARDASVAKALAQAGVAPHASLDHVYFGANDILTGAGAPYRVFTPYFRRWNELLRLAPRAPADSRRALRRLLPRASLHQTREVPAPAELGVEALPAFPRPSERAARERLTHFLAPGGAAERYAVDRDLPALDGTSALSPHLRAGTIGIRTCVCAALDAARAADGDAAKSIEKWIAELAWRDFYQAILYHFPHVSKRPFLEAGRRIAWSADRAAFDAWCAGRTGYPIVDAAMRQLNQTGWMHNRLRMIVASFLTKDLLIDWRWGERYFERRLADADLAQNNGGWQWAASTGTDAVPYFRIFNPVLQGERFDPGGAFVRAMIPELAGVPDRFVHEPWKAGAYLPPIVDREAARRRALAAYAAAWAKP